MSIIPMNIATINRELSEIIAKLAEAHASRDHGISIDLTPVTIRATQLCDHIIQLSPEEAAKLLPDLQNAVDSLNAIHQNIKAS